MSFRKGLSVEDLAWNLKSPCGDCPFRKDSPFHEGVAANVENLWSVIERGKFAHTCHKTDNYPTCDGPKNWKKEKPEHCAGAILMLLKTGEGYDLQWPLLRAAELGKIDLSEMTKIAKKTDNVFTLSEFIQFQLKATEGKFPEWRINNE